MEERFRQCDILDLDPSHFLDEDTGRHLDTNFEQEIHRADSDSGGGGPSTFFSAGSSHSLTLDDIFDIAIEKTSSRLSADRGRGLGTSDKVKTSHPGGDPTPNFPDLPPKVEGT